MNKCPKCNAVISNVSIQDIGGQAIMGEQWKTITYTCPYCFSVLGVQIDPVALKSDIVNEVIERLQRR